MIKAYNIHKNYGTLHVLKGVNLHIQKGEIQPIAAQGMQMIWLYSSIMMLLSSIWLFFLAKPIKEGKHVARLQVLYMSIGLLAFGLGCSYIAQEVFNHLFFFTVEGILLLLAVTIFYKREAQS